MTAAELADEPRPDSEWRSVDADAAYAFARATNDDNERYADGTAVPPLFTATIVLPNWPRMPRLATPHPVVTGASTSLHGEHDVFFHAPVLPGMRLRVESDLHGARQTRGGALVTQRHVVRDEHGAALVTHLWSNIHVGGTLAAEAGDAAPDHTFPEAARATPLDVRTLFVDRDQAYRYAGVSSDHAPHAIDDETARREGYPGKILQGMCTFALCSAAMVDMVAGRDPDRLRRLAGRFAAPAFPAREMAVTAYDAGTTADGYQAFAFEAVQDGVAVIKHGRAEVTPA